MSQGRKKIRYQIQGDNHVSRHQQEKNLGPKAHSGIQEQTPEELKELRKVDQEKHEPLRPDAKKRYESREPHGNMAKDRHETLLNPAAPYGAFTGRGGTLLGRTGFRTMGQSLLRRFRLFG